MGDSDEPRKRADSRSETGRRPARHDSAIDYEEETTDVTDRVLLPRRPTMSGARTPARFMLALQEGSPVGEYEIQSQIGEGAMGTVYSAVHPLIGKTVAIKVLKPELCSNQGSIDRFVQEAQAVNRIGHPNIVDVFALGELPDGRAYFVMEWLRGEDLKSRMARGPIPVADTCDILDGIARALDAAHGKDIVHRDLKPDNVFLHQIDSGPIMVKLLDFGIAKLLRDKVTTEKTQTGSMLGTPRYISPEQARGIDVTHRSDIYSLGVMAYEMLAGRPPFFGETGMDLVVAHLNEPAPALSQFARVPKSLEQIVMSMLAKSPADRPTLAVVRRILVDPTQRVSRLDIRRPARSLVRTRRALIAGAAVALVGAGVLAWQLMRGDGDGDAPAPVATPAVPAPAVVAAKPVTPPTVLANGTLDIRVNGPDAVILVDGVEWGRGAAIKVSVAPGSHEVVVRAEGRPQITRTVDVAAGAPVPVTVDVPMPPKAAPAKTVARPRPRPKTPTPPPPPATPKAPDEDTLLKPKGHR